MKSKILLSVFVLVVLPLFLTGCENTISGNTIVGSWEYGSFVYTFNKDNTCTYDAGGTIMKCTYETDGDKLSISYEKTTVPFETTYSIDGNKLNIKDSFGHDTIYEKI